MAPDPMQHNPPAPGGSRNSSRAMQPGFSRTPADFRADVVDFTDSLRATRPADPARPVMVAGDPERRNAARRKQEGIPVGINLLAKVKGIAEASGAEWVLG